MPIVGGFWPVGQLLDAYMYKIQLSNMRLGGSKPKFNEEFSYCNYIGKFYTVWLARPPRLAHECHRVSARCVWQVGMCGLCGAALKKWVDAQIVMGEPTFDDDMGAEDAELDAADAGQEGAPKYLPTAAPTRTSPTVHAPPVVTVQNQQPADTEMAMSEIRTSPTVHAPPVVTVQNQQPADTKMAMSEILASCGLEHRAKLFQEEGYTLDLAFGALASGQDTLLADLRALKLPLGECRKLIGQIEAAQAVTDP